MFEIEKQFGSLKRQAAKARRYRRLRDEHRHWEKVLVAGRYGAVAGAIDALQARLSDGRDQESVAVARLSTLEADFDRVRIELVEAEARATAAREVVHGCELGITRRQQQVAFDRQQIAELDRRVEGIVAELEMLEARREPSQAALAARRAAATQADIERERAGAALVEMDREVRGSPPTNRRPRGRCRGRSVRGVRRAQRRHRAAARGAARGRSARPGAGGVEEARP